MLTLDNLDFTIFIGLGADLGALGIQHQADRHTQLLAGCLHSIHTGFVLFVRAVAEVHTGNIHAGFDQLGQNSIGCGAKGTNDFRFAHRNIVLSEVIGYPL